MRIREPGRALIAAGVYLLVLLFVFAMCRAAAQGDEQRHYQSDADR